MTHWDIITWAAIGILGPGALIIFLAFLKGLRRRPTAEQRDGSDDPAR